MTKTETDIIRRHAEQIAREVMISLGENVGPCISEYVTNELLTALDIQSALFDAADNLED